MLERLTRKPWLLLFVLTSSCGTVQVPNTEVCVVAGKLLAGADCAFTLHGNSRSMTMEEFIVWLEPSTEKGPALCQSATDWNKQKTALEQACKILGNKCTFESELRMVSARIDALTKPRRVNK